MVDQRQHIRPLTGLRFFAALLVFIHHLPESYGLRHLHVPVGAFGVSFFFVLSGFILTYVYNGRLGSWSSVRKFWFARWARIWPVHVATLLACVFCVLGTEKAFAAAGEVQKFLLNIVLIQTWVPDITWAMGFNHVSWSIATEFFFYFAFPFLILLAPTKFWTGFVGLGAMCVAGVAVGQELANSMPAGDDHALFVSRALMVIHVNPLARLWEFAAGMAVGKVFLAQHFATSNERSTWVDSIVEVLTLSMVAIGLWGVFRISHWSGQYSDYSLWTRWLKITGGSVFFVPLVYVLATRRGFIAQFLSTRLLVYLGEISFAFYMIHQLVLRAMPELVVDFQSFGFWFCALSTFVISLALAAAIYGLVEMPAKSYLLRAYASDWRAGFRSVGAQWVTFATSRPAQAAFVGLGCAIVVLNIEATERYERQFDDRMVSKLIDKSEVHSLPLKFGDDAVLHGATMEIGDDGAMVVKLVWEKTRAHTRHRFIHVVDANEKIVANPVVRTQQKNFLGAPACRKFVEEVVLEPHHLAGGVKVSVGLYSHAAGAAPVSGGQRSMNGNRLDLARIAEDEGDRVAIRVIEADARGRMR